VDFTFSAEQDALRDVARSFLAAEANGEYVREMMERDDRGFTDEMWSKLGEMGWTGVLLPAEQGGAGLGVLEAVVIAEEMGKLPMPGPWLSSSVCATLTAVALGDGDGLSALANEERGTLAVEENGTRDPLDSVHTTAEPSGHGYVLHGVKPLVLDGHTADFAYVVAREKDGSLATFVVDNPSAELVPSLDVTRKMTRLVLDGRTARRVGPAGDQRALLARVIDDIGIVLCAESVGACDRAIDMATEYAKVRVQFDRPIATFQAIRHKIVDMLHQQELSRVATHYAAWVSDDNALDREAAAASCKGFVGEAAAMITGENIQVHGGVGFTWDIDAHLLFRRVKANDVMFGRQGWQRERLAELVLSGAV